MRHLLRHEATLGADRHDHRVLHLLRFHQAEDLGAEVLRPVGPADAAARHLAEAQVHAFDPRRIDEDLVERARQRQIGDLAALELDRDQRAGLPFLVGLEEIGADRRLHRIDEVTQDAVLVEALHILQFLLDAGDDLFLLGVALRGCRRARIEARVEQFDNVGDDDVVLHQRRPHVVLRIGHADLPQIARQRADKRDVAPAETAGKRQRVEAVILGGAAHHHQECGFQPRLALVELDRRAVATFQQHVVEPDVARAFVFGLDVEGALIDHAEAHVFQHRHALRQRQRPRKTPYFQAHRALLFLQPVVKIDAERPLLAQAFDHADVGRRHARRIGVLEAGGKGVAIAREQPARCFRRVGQRQRLRQPISPGADDVGDRVFQRHPIDVRGRPAGAADDEVHPHQRAFGEERIERRDVADKGACQIVADFRADMAVVAFARHEYQHRDKTVEAVAPRQNAHARPLVELHDGERKLVKRVLVDLEQFVARIMFEHVGERLAEMARRIKAGARLDIGDLAAQIRNVVRRARIGGGGEQADDTKFADQVAGGIEAFDADVIEIDAPVHVRVDIGLGDDQRPRLFEKRHDLRRDLEQLLAAAQHAQLARTHDAEPAVEVRLQVVAVEDIVAHADKGEIVGEQPFEEFDRFRDLIHRQRRRIGLQLGDDGVDALAHRPPVLHRKPHLAEHRLQRLHDGFAQRLVFDRIDVNVDETFARAASGIRRAESGELAGRVALDAEDRMRDQPHGEMPLGQLTHHRVEQERHVVVDDLDHRDRFAIAGGFERQRLEADLRRARLALAEEIPRRARRASPDRRRRNARRPQGTARAKSCARKLSGMVRWLPDSAAPACSMVRRAVLSTSSPEVRASMRSSRWQGRSVEADGSLHLPQRGVESNTPFGDAVVTAVLRLRSLLSQGNALTG